jgi:hypothetical protein
MAQPTQNVTRLWLGFLYPDQQTQRQPTALDTYSQQYADIPYLANQFQYLSNERDMFAPAENSIVWLYNQFSEQQNPYYKRLMDVNSRLNQENIGRLNEIRQNVYNQYWPEGEQQKQLQDYYDNLAKYYASQAGNEKARINADTVGTGASIWQARAARSDLENKLLGNALQIQDKKLKDYQGVYNTFNKYLQDLQAGYGNSNDRYVKSVYDQITQNQQELGANLVNNLTNIGNMRAQYNMQQALKNAVPVRWSGVVNVPQQQQLQQQAMKQLAQQTAIVNPVNQYYSFGGTNQWTGSRLTPEQLANLKLIK